MFIADIMPQVDKLLNQTATEMHLFIPLCMIRFKHLLRYTWSLKSADFRDLDQNASRMHLVWLQFNYSV